MVYIIWVKEYVDEENYYTLFEANTETVFGGRETYLKDLITKNKLEVKNAKIVNNQIKVDHTSNDLVYTDYVLLCQIDQNSFKLVDYNGDITYVDKTRLLVSIAANKIANCEFKNGKFISIGAYGIIKDTQFEQHINDNYKTYIAKTSLLGDKMSFDYKIEGNQVKLIKYNGISKKVIVPKFVTTIMEGAFMNCGIEELTLDKGLLHIGESAFGECNIEKVTIPDTVEFMFSGAFYNNKRLVDSNGKYKKTIKIMNPKINVIEWR